MENKRGHWRQIKDTQLNDWMDGPLDLNGHQYPTPVPQPQGRKMSASGLCSSASATTVDKHADNQSYR